MPRKPTRQRSSSAPGPPDFSVTVIGTPSKSLTLAQLQGKDVLLEFWATWCGPCIKTQDELVRLHEKFSDQGLQIVAISDESPDVIARYLHRHPVPYTVAAADKGLGQDQYRLRGLPYSVLIDKKGLVQWIGHPGFLSNNVMMEYLRSGKAPESWTPPTTTAPAEPAAHTTLTIKIAQTRFKQRLAASSQLQYFQTPTALIIQVYRGRQLPLSDILKDLLETSKPRLLVDPVDGDILYDVEFTHAPGHGDPDPRLFLNALLREAGLELHEVEEMRDVWVAAPPARELHEDKSPPQAGLAEDGRFVARGETIEDFFKGLENWYGIFVVDETRLTGPYQLSYYPKQSWEETRQYLDREHGFILKPDRRKVHLFKLQTASEPSTKPAHDSMKSE